MNAIVSVTSDWGIGNNGRLLVRNRADMHRFVELTRGGTVLMGRTTFESFPKGPLVGRRNVVITHDAHYERAGYPRSDGAGRDAGGGGGTGYEVYTTPEDALRAVVGEGDGKVWLIGGESVYRALLPRCSRAYVTKNDTVVEADAYFPNLDENPAWRSDPRRGVLLVRHLRAAVVARGSCGGPARTACPAIAAGTMGRRRPSDTASEPKSGGPAFRTPAYDDSMPRLAIRPVSAVDGTRCAAHAPTRSRRPGPSA